MQLMLFDEPLKILVERKIDLQNASLERMRKKLFAENNSLKKEIKDLKRDLEFLKANICKGDYIL